MQQLDQRVRARRANCHTNGPPTRDRVQRTGRTQLLFGVRVGRGPRQRRRSKQVDQAGTRTVQRHLKAHGAAGRLEMFVQRPQDRRDVARADRFEPERHHREARPIEQEAAEVAVPAQVLAVLRAALTAIRARLGSFSVNASALPPTAGSRRNAARSSPTSSSTAGRWRSIPSASAIGRRGRSQTNATLAPLSTRRATSPSRSRRPRHEVMRLKVPIPAHVR